MQFAEAEAEAELAGSVRAAQLFANAQVAVDLLLLTVILRFTGGVENPLALFYVFHIAIAALLLPRRQAIAQALWAVGLYAALGFGELTGLFHPHHAFLPAVASPGWYADPRYVTLTVVSQACGALGVLYFTLQIAARLDRRDQQLWLANEALRKSQTAIQDLQERRSRFMQTAAHQLKTPLAVIQTLAALIHDNIVPPENVEPTAEKIVRRCHEGIAQLNELLALARVQEADPQRHREVRTDVGELVARLCRQLEPVAREKGLTFHWRVPAHTDLWAHVDPRDAADCIGNLIDNAIKYTPAPGTVSVKVSSLDARQLRFSRKHRPTDPRRGYVYVTVKDTGIGIDPAALPARGGRTEGSIFDAFRRGNNAIAAGIPGSGLGLSVVREVVEQSNGMITVRSAPGAGSTFTVAFPADRVAASGSIPDTRSSTVVEAGAPDAGEPSTPESVWQTEPKS